MATIDAGAAECLVFTFKEGLLSPMAHNLKLRVTRFQLEVDDTTKQVRVTVDPASIRVVNAVKEGIEDPGALSDTDRAKIESNVRERVLDVDRFPEIRFESTAATPSADGYQVRGMLTLHGVRRELSFPIRKETTPAGERLAGEVTIHQPDFGIKPYTAMMGALKVQADVKVRISAPVR